MANKLRFGTGGLPLTTKPSGLVNGIKRMHELGLEHLEMEFVQSVYVKADQAPEVKAAAEENDVTLSVHGSYFVNLASPESAKFYASINRVASAAYIGDLCGARSVTYHSGFMQGGNYDDLSARIIEGMEKILEELKAKGTKQIKISPELTGKATQFGDLPSLIDLNKRLKAKGHDNVALCIDFAHNYARFGGRNNTYAEFRAMLEQVEKELGREYLEDLHIHVSGIEYGDKGEKNHLIFLPTLEDYAKEGVVVDRIESEFEALDQKRLQPNKFNWQELLKALKDMDVKGYVVCESPILELDALLMQKYYNSL